MEEVQDYKLVVAKGSNKLSELVNEELDNGYILYGNPVMTQTFIGNDEEGKPQLVTLMSQAVTLPFDDEEAN